MTPQERKDFFLDQEAPDWCHGQTKWPYKPRRFGVLQVPHRPARRRVRLAGAKGVLVTRVSSDLPAEAAGFKPGDLIMFIASEPVRSVKEADKAL